MGGASEYFFKEPNDYNRLHALAELHRFPTMETLKAADDAFERHRGHEFADACDSVLGRPSGSKSWME
jgi:hypothetical protein